MSVLENIDSCEEWKTSVILRFPLQLPRVGSGDAREETGSCNVDGATGTA